jgi:hypothetical protein
VVGTVGYADGASPGLINSETATVDDGPSCVNRPATPSALQFANCAHLQRTTTAMDSHSLKTASAYINNLLLARGLLRDGKAIEFAHPSRGEGGKEQTMAHIINLVHDLILKRDVSAAVFVRVPSTNNIHSATKNTADPLPKPCVHCVPNRRARRPLSTSCRHAMKTSHAKCPSRNHRNARPAPPSAPPNHRPVVCETRCCD